MAKRMTFADWPDEVDWPLSIPKVCKSQTHFHSNQGSAACPMVLDGGCVSMYLGRVLDPDGAISGYTPSDKAERAALGRLKAYGFTVEQARELVRMNDRESIARSGGPKEALTLAMKFAGFDVPA
jgi:hypothetical protein